MSGCTEERVPEGHRCHLRKCGGRHVQDLPGGPGAEGQIGCHWHDVTVWGWLAPDSAEGGTRDAAVQVCFPQWLLPHTLCLPLQAAPVAADQLHDARPAEGRHGLSCFQVSVPLVSWYF